MTAEVLHTTHGRPATEALARVIAGAQRERPLAPVTVVVPSNVAGLSSRRLLGGPPVGGGPGGGLVNVRFLTPFQLAELLAGDLADERRSLTNPVLGAAVRRALADDPGPFAPVAAHHATETAVTALYAELSHVGPATLRALEGAGGIAAASVRLHRAVTAHLDGIETEDDLVRAATARPDLAAVVQPLGHVVWFLPEPATPALESFLGAVLDLAPATVIVGGTGEPGVDQPVLDACRRAGVDPGAPAVAVEAPTATRIVSVTDPDEEARAATREVLALVASGVRPDRIAVFAPTTDPYLPLLHRHLTAAGILTNGPAPDRLADSVAGRTLLAALALPAERWRRDRVMALVAGAPVRHRGAPVRPTAWDQISRRAGVVGGGGDWRGKLRSTADALDARADALDADLDGHHRERLRRDAADARSLADFVADLGAAVQRVTSARGWGPATAAALDLLRSLVGDDRHRSSWPEPERDAAERVEAALARLAALDAIEPDPSTEVIRRALAGELDAPRGRIGRFGEGVQVAPLVSAVGQDLDAVVVVGLAEGVCPAPRRDDSLLPDAARAHAAAGELPLRAGRLHDQHRALLAALASAPAHRRVLLVPRGDLRGGRQRLPSRWALDTASRLCGRPVASDELHRLGPPVVEVVPSHATGVRTAPVHASLLDHDLAALHAHVTAGGDPLAHPALDAATRRALTAQVARRSPRFTEWDGNLAGLPVRSPARDDALLSATGLERWAACGFRYLLASVLGLATRDDPERVVELSALDRGSGVHAVLERFLLEVLADGPPDPDTPWSPAWRARLHEIAAEVFAELEASGRTGRPLHWRLERERLTALLDDWLTADDRFRATTGARPERVELPFGFDDVAPVEVALGDGRVVRFRGRADRVDVDPTGRRLVTDYKTGKGTEYRHLDDDPVRGGTTLQLGLYSEAARQVLGASEAAAHYWMVNDDAGFARRGYTWTDDRRQRFVEVVTAIVDGIEAGAFPAVPGEWDAFRGTYEGCRHCDFDAVCPRDRGEQAAAKVDAPELRVRARLLPADEVDA
ncbi:MAG TPA: PD-(D/E)XK nuclease family protein [Acidimicrobiales bacterium]|nr:PD-(D/E)XK nuclease family protein [Acidimicrobiales bacterium]